MAAEKRPVVVIACRVFQHLFEQHLAEAQRDRVTFLEYGLHRVPAKLTVAIQEAIDAIHEPSLILLGYGLCGNGLAGVQAGQHTLLIPRADDCIAILLGSRAAYLHEFESEPGTYYLTKGWLESGSDPLKEFHEYSEKYGPEQGDMVDGRAVPALPAAGFRSPFRGRPGGIPAESTRSRSFL